MNDTENNQRMKHALQLSMLWLAVLEQSRDVEEAADARAASVLMMRLVERHKAERKEVSA